MKIQMIVLNIRRKLIDYLLFQSILNFVYRFLFSTNSIRRIKIGYCTLCGKKNLMLIDALNLRGTGFCFFCGSHARNRGLAEILKKILIIKLINNHFNKNLLKQLIVKLDLEKYSLKHVIKHIPYHDFRIYEPSSLGVISIMLKNFTGFIYSEYYKNIKSKYFKSIRFEDLQDLSFDDNSLDIIITQDTLEHVKNPELAFKEIYRVLKPNGIHIFTVPIGNNPKTTYFFNENGEYLKKNAVFHKDPFSIAGAKVYTYFGTDIINILKKYHFTSFLIIPKINPKIGIFSKFKIVISIK